MVDNIEDFQAVTRLSEAFHRAQVRDDLNNDMAGREVGRISRLGHGNIGIAIAERKRRERMDRLLIETALDALMRDPVYRARHEAFGQFLDQHEEAVRTALQRATEMSETAQAAVRHALENANTLEGKAVFVAKDGRILYADGTEIDPAHADRIVWRDGAKTYEEFVVLTEAATSADAAVSDIQAHGDRVGASRAKWSSPDDPYGSAEAMDEARQRLEANAPETIKQTLSATIDAGPSASTAHSG